jgi:HEPN domain-containing protein
MAQPYPQTAFISDLVHRAADFYAAYHTLTKASPNALPPSWPRYFLLSHSIELTLKAFLAVHGKTSEELRKKFGHDLNKLLKEATNRGLVLGPDARKDIALLEIAHNNHWARYPNEDSKPVVVIEEFEKTAFELLEQVRSAIQAAMT